jgi:D-beta-D-heptose 7-phosphate kinase/D-beta-D-heptose 1-phosphate adenosyltransferase
MAAGLASEDSLENSTRLANVAAGLVVGKVGTATVTREELEGALSQPTGDAADGLPSIGVVTEDEALIAVASMKAEGKRLVMTNGCFDLLHPGHVSYLSQAAELADVLIVAVNDDASVARLKGPDRPINGIESRMSVLAGLRAVSYVVPFSEDTPARLISAISPDVLVKGGDYAITDIAGHEHVLASGGDVVILDFVEGFSTTATIERMSSDS